MRVPNGPVHPPGLPRSVVSTKHDGHGRPGDAKGVSVLENEDDSHQIFSGKVAVPPFLADHVLVLRHRKRQEAIPTRSEG